MIIADTSGLLALYNRREPAHVAVAQAVTAAVEPLVVSPYVVAELDYLLATRLGVEAEIAVLRELAAGAYEHAVLATDDLAACAEVVGRYRDQAIGVTDASLVVLADRYRTRTVLTLDRRHFNALRPLTGGRFTLLPASCRTLEGRSVRLGRPAAFSTAIRSPVAKRRSSSCSPTGTSRPNTGSNNTCRVRSHHRSITANTSACFDGHQ